nr:stage V sporulation protein AA [Lachnospiraceae bacterium]
MKNFVYIEMEDSVQVREKSVRISDVASVYAADPAVCAGVKNIVLYKFEKKEKQVISLLWLTASVQAKFPDCLVIPHGESDCIVEWKDSAAQKGFDTLLGKLKVLVVSLICLFGGAFSIMAFHNDISITNIFSQFYEFVTGNSSGGFTLLEVSYSLGLLIGILVFYNHVGKKKITSEPTPIEVSMRNYERDMDEAIIKRRDREGSKVDVQ